MKYFTLLLTTLLLIPTMSYADTWVNGYTRKDGTHVKGHYRSDRNNTVNDNWSTRGNRNPYTGTYGTKPRTYDSDYNKKQNSYGYNY